MDYSKWKDVHYDSDEELCRPPDDPDPQGLRSWISRNERQNDASRKQFIAEAAVETERQRELGRRRQAGAPRRRGPSCWTCHAADAKLRCARCKQVYFCSRECQQNGWKAHKFQCRQTTENEALRAQKSEEWNEMLCRRARQEELEYGPLGELGPVQKMIMEDAEQSGWVQPPFKEDGSLSVAVIIPFRQQLPLQDRGSQLRRLVALLHGLFGRLAKGQWLRSWKLLVVEQAEDGRPFNRGALLNAGFRHLEAAGERVDQVILHDVDLLPASENTEAWYAAEVPPQHVLHLTSEGYKKYPGSFASMGAAPGVVAVRWEDFKASNGFPLDVWGWAEHVEAQVWFDRLGAKGMNYLPCSVGEWQDLDRVDLRDSPEALEDPVKWYDSRWLEIQLPEASAQPCRADGRVLIGPAEEPKENSPERMEWLLDRSGGLNSVDFYKVLREEPYAVFATHVEVLLNQNMPSC